MEWLPLVVVAAVILVGRRVVMRRWYANRLGSRRAALLVAALPATMVPLAIAVTRGVSGFWDASLLVGIALFMFGSSFAFADFLFRAVKGEMDRPTNRQ